MTPDFYLTTAGENHDLSSLRKCYVKGRLKDKIRDDHMLIEIDPPLIGQEYGLGGTDISILLLSARFEGETLYPIDEWPSHVYVSRILDENITKCDEFTREQIEMIAWGMIFNNLEDAKNHIKKHQS